MMSKAILLSIRPEHAYNIMNGIKKYEVRKNSLKSGDIVYGYITKAKPYIIKIFGRYSLVSREHSKRELLKSFNDWEDFENNVFNGQVLFRFEVGEIKKLKWGRWVNQSDFNYRGYNNEHDEIIRKSCLTHKQILEYGDRKPLYFHEIKNLEIFSQPKTLSDFYSKDLSNHFFIDYDHERRAYEKATLKRAPQSWQYVWVKE